MNVKMPALKAGFEAAGFTGVRTILSSGNVAFDSSGTDERALEQIAEAAMQQCLGRTFYTVVLSTQALRTMLHTDPYASHGIPGHAKRVMTFMREPRPPKVALPLAQDGASVFLLTQSVAYTAYVPSDKGPVFMRLIERVFGKDVTTRTVETVAKCAAA